MNPSTNKSNKLNNSRNPLHNRVPRGNLGSNSNNKISVKPPKTDLSNEHIRSSRSSIDSGRISSMSKYTILPSISGDKSLNHSEVSSSISSSSAPVSTSVTTLTLALRMPDGKRIVEVIKDCSVTLKRFLMHTAKKNHYKLDIDYIEVLNGALPLGNQIPLSDDELNSPISKFNFVDRSVLILQYSA